MTGKITFAKAACMESKIKFHIRKTMSEAVEKLNTYLNFVGNQFGREVKVLKSDNCTEIKNARSRIIFDQLGIFNERSVAYMPEQNAQAEIHAKDLGRFL